MRLTGLPKHLRAWGLQVTVTDGWQQRGADFASTPAVLVAHHTATPARVKGDMPTLSLLVEGRSDLPGPLCQVGLGRTGRVYMVAAGRANHAGNGSWDGVSVGNSRSVGIEAEHPGGNDPWPPAQLAAYDLLCAALLDYLDQGAGRLCGHKESALPRGRKVDPNLDMAAMRKRVGALLTRGAQAQVVTAPDPSTTNQEDDDMLYAKVTDTASLWQVRPWDKQLKRIDASVKSLMGEEAWMAIHVYPTEAALQADFAGYKVVA